MRALRRLWVRVRGPFGSQKTFVGEDLAGNKYFEADSLTGSGLSKRSVVWAEKKAYNEYDPDALPVQWQAWLRHTRPSAPTLEELQKHEIQKQIMAERARMADEGWKQELAALRKSQNPETITGRKIHDELPAPAPSATTPTPPESTPVGQGESFVPGTWTPARNPRR
ncbi:hypothetical protein SeMB42_g01035 [Synchytrium endobioticum]|uniref:NADH dehydrogenase [ubiquinone] 1 alpha subcomplex subunit n=1 Tax=Synchytrium endobioticum TaxID=286115 RepID=A0A507DN92_9FUNG|nr:hypothetical protein SeLEV6574_g00495 [Synchytrium endobioticum]TPX53053.1 hypothetical protein SeMB42_g01035 [Synchytrium endobioticum]